MAQWKLHLSNGKYLREAIEEEDYDGIFAWLEMLYQDINDKMPEYYTDEDLRSDLADIEDVADSQENMDEYDLTEDDIEEMVDGLLAKFYDLCDAYKIWVGI